jgi:hypothetical protein
VPTAERPLLGPTLEAELGQLANGYQLPFDVVPFDAAGPLSSLDVPAAVPTGASPLSSYEHANAVDIGFRAAMDLLPTSVLEAELSPENSFPIPVFPIQPTFDVNDAFTIDPGLVRIAEDYGFMRAADVLPHRPT